ncbi:hypothetical protein UCREL1_10396 [Eutypa lata UCREL1]|uniref:Uncharacterized protein n=1 Tax=Eutypa lata (strain UCR-EL1) TaxID=1287681 RepID=M7SEP4_EUTLA|nr:hypothetical protein UCREL1_10396 [Eutypa lata UCREL1]
MKLLSIISVALTALFVFTLADTNNYVVASNAAAEAGVTPEENMRFAIYEYWHNSGSAAIADCVAGFSHVRLIVGKFDSLRSDEKDFAAETYDMISDGRSWQFYGGRCEQQKPNTWEANAYYIPEEKRWQDISVPNTYVWAGPVRKGVGSKTLKKIGESTIITRNMYD